MPGLDESFHEKNLIIVMKAAQFSGKALLNVVQKFLDTGSKPSIQLKDELKNEEKGDKRFPFKKSKIKISKLAKGGKQLETFPINDKDKSLKAFNKIMKKSGVKYAVLKDGDKMNIFVQASDKNITQAFESYVKYEINKKKEKPSLLDKLKKNQEKVKSQNKELVKEKTKDRGMER